MKKKNDGLDFIRERNEQLKKEIKSRKNWRKSITYELGLQRTYKYNRQDELRKMWRMANIMINEYEKVLKQHETMLEELENVLKEEN